MALLERPGPRDPVSIGTFFPDAGPPQLPSDVAVVIPTVLRPEIIRAVKSVFDQDYEGRIQIVIGQDVARGSSNALIDLLMTRPDNVSALFVALPYSTSYRHGGVHAASDGGAIRAILSYAANARHVAYLDDDNSYLPQHIRLLREVIEGRAWSSGQRLLLDEDTDEHLAVDVWDSVGPGRGRFKAEGGFVDPNCLMIDKVHASWALGVWSSPGPGKYGRTTDRAFFKAINNNSSYAQVMRPTVLYRVRKSDVMRQFMAENRVFD